MEFEVKESKKIEDGAHEGVIVGVVYRTDPYEYTDIQVKENGSEVVLKYGCPSEVTDKSRLGRLLSKFTEVRIGDKLDPESILKDKKVIFMTLNNDKGFTDIVVDSIKPKPEEKEEEKKE